MAKIYAVKQGRETGLFNTWKECEAQVKGFSGAQFKSFGTEEEAVAYLNGVEEQKDKPIKPSKEEILERELYLTELISADPSVLVVYTDGSNTNDGRYSHAFVVVKDNEITYESYAEGNNPEAASMRNVAGELAAAMNAALYTLKEEPEVSKLVIFHDYEGVSEWIHGTWKTGNKLTEKYKQYMLSFKEKIDLQFVKVDGHIGNPFNERADYLAKEALGLNKK